MPDVFDLIKTTQGYLDDRKELFQFITPEKLTESLTIIAELEKPFILLPALKTSGTATTSTTLPYVSMPESPVLKRHIYKVSSSERPESEGYKPINIIKTDHKLREYWGADLGEEGDVEDVYPDFENQNLYYQGIPTEADTLTLYGYKGPTAITFSTTSFTDIPEAYVNMTLCVHCAAIVMLENGFVNEAGKKLDIFKIGIGQLYEKIRPTYELPDIKRIDWCSTRSVDTKRMGYI